MAELEIQQKKRPVWPWLAGLALLIGLIWVGAEMFGGADEPEPFMAPPAAVEDQTADPYAARPGDLAAEIEAFRSACGSASTVRDEMAENHQHEAGCLRQLADALAAAITMDTIRDEALGERLDVLRERADDLARDPASTEHAAQLSAAVDEAVLVVEEVAGRRPDMSQELDAQLTELRTAATEVTGSQVLLDQKRSVGAFFDHAASILTTLSRDTGAEL